MPLALRAPRPRARTIGFVTGGSGPTIASRGSESEAGEGDFRSKRLSLLVAISETLSMSGLLVDRLGDRDLCRCLDDLWCVLARGDSDRVR
jgi:hypothetical protein